MQFFRGFGIKEGTRIQVLVQPLRSEQAFAADCRIIIQKITKAKRLKGDGATN